MLTKIVLYLVAATVAVASLWWVISVWQNRNLLKGYGVSYEKTYGEHESYQHIQFYWARSGERIKGPEVTGDDLYVRFKSMAGEGAPEIVVRSKDYKSHLVVFRLNFTDASKPEFEMLENQMMGIWYPPPWENYYSRNRGNAELQPKNK
jgi:hypothetical protein